MENERDGKLTLDRERGGDFRKRPGGDSGESRAHQADFQKSHIPFPTELFYIRCAFPFPEFIARHFKLFNITATILEN